MGIKFQAFGFNTLRDMVCSELNASHNELVEALVAIGERMCDHARANGEYKDDTGVLRGSIAGRLYYNSEEVVSFGFEGEGVKYAEEALDEYPVYDEGYVLVIVAGAPYAEYIEAKGYNVLHLTRVELQREIAALQGK